jgi:hypothetical protein
MQYSGSMHHLASGSWTHAVSAPTGMSNIVKLVQATNVTSSAATLNLAVSGSGTEKYYLAKEVSINTQASYVVVDQAITIPAGLHLVGECININNGIDLVTSYLQASSSIS